MEVEKYETSSWNTSGETIKIDKERILRENLGCFREKLGKVGVQKNEGKRGKLGYEKWEETSNDG